MKEEKLFDAITDIDEKYIEEAKDENIKIKRFSKMKISGIAASFVAVIGIVIILALIPFGGMGANAGGGFNREPGENYMSYSGPAFPLSSIGETEGLVFERATDFDFSPYYPKGESYENADGETVYYTVWDHHAIVSENFSAKNNTEKDITFTAVYPFAGNLSNTLSELPEITLDGTKTEAKLNIGPYSGGFSPAWGDENGESESLNLSILESWHEYKSLLETGEYFEMAFDEYPSLDIPVKVYSFEAIYNIDMESFDDIDNPDIIIEFDYNHDETKFFYYGFNGMRADCEEGRIELSSYVPKSFNPDFGRDKRYIIVMNGDIDNISAKAVAGYIERHNDERIETDAFSVKTECYETVLYDVIYDIVRSYNAEAYYGADYEESIRDVISDEEYVGLVAEMLYDYGQLSESPVQRYDGGRLDEIIIETSSVSRVMYLTFDVTVPAGETVEIGAKCIREASYDFFGEREELYLEGFDLVTAIGTNLVFEKQSASVSNTEYIDIIYNNFGFDLANGISKVTLGDEEHYWMEITRKKTE